MPLWYRVAPNAESRILAADLQRPPRPAYFSTLQRSSRVRVCRACDAVILAGEPYMWVEPRFGLCRGCVVFVSDEQIG